MKKEIIQIEKITIDDVKEEKVTNKIMVTDEETVKKIWEIASGYWVNESLKIIGG